ncbi:hypothetical protein TNCV_4598641, partial [Trichonephila clavipes]
TACNRLQPPAPPAPPAPPLQQRSAFLPTADEGKSMLEKA